MYMNEINSGKKLKFIETDDINKIPYEGGNYIIVSDGLVYYDPTFGTNINDRVCLNPKHEVDIYERTDNKSDEYYLSLHVNPIIGDIVIIKELIPNTNKYSYTSYTYNNNPEDTNLQDWYKTEEAYNASNVYLDRDITITVQLGDEPLENGKRVINTAGKSVAESLEMLLSTDKFPTIIQPSISISFPENGSYEIGTTITPTYSITLHPGSYEYGPETGVTVTSYNIISNNGIIKDKVSGSFNPIVIDEDTEFYINSTVHYSGGNIPLTLREEEYETGRIQAGTVGANSEKITGYINGIYYGCVDTTVTEDNISSEIIRDLNKTGYAYEPEEIKLDVNPNTKSIIIAYQKGVGNISNIHNNTVNANMNDSFGLNEEPLTVKVASGDNDVNSKYARDYNVFIYTPAEPYEQSASLTISFI